MRHPKVDYNDSMGEMRDYDEEGWGKKERRRWIIYRIVIILGSLYMFILFIGSLINYFLPDVVLPYIEGVVIEDIRNDDVYNKMGSSTYAEIKNNGLTAINLEGWRLNAGDPGEDFYFPAYTLRPQRSCRVYTNEMHLPFCGFSFGIDRDIWGSSDCGYLYDDDGVLVDEYCF